VAEVVCGGLLARDVAMILDGTPRRLRQGPALLLWLEAATAAAATVAGLRPVLDDEARRRALTGSPRGSELVRRCAVGTLFGLHTLRFWIYLQPGQGRRRRAALVGIQPEGLDGEHDVADARAHHR
jgi:hypothetical protein